VLPSGRPLEDVKTLTQDDPTWAAEYTHFKSLCTHGTKTDLSGDLWLHRVLSRLGKEAVRKMRAG
jgi:hypothetical protein